ncbi:MAG: hypothetical protein D4R65_14870 [Verrucomicrobiaceae bacterium]|nr:MAG: hypothetical protein D4R65_14870 [Verrucomicrobiaceae bacterium]
MIQGNLAIISALLAGAILATSHAADRKPNILLIVTDDQGFGDFGFMGNPNVKTPNLDRLASESAVFSNFVVTPACSPTRASLLTGRNHLRTGVWGVGSRAFQLRDEVIAPAFFQKAGYRTFHCGKGDSTSLLELQAWDRGYDDAALLNGPGKPEKVSSGGYTHRDPMIATRESNTPVEGWTVDVMNDRILEFIKKPGAQPWFVNASYIVPHLPWICDERFSKPCRDAGFSEELAACYGSIAQLDAAVGHLLDEIRNAGQDTIVLLFSDNGATSPDVGTTMSSNDPASASTDWKRRNFLGLRGSKATIWENGIRSTLFVRWPGHVPPGPRAQLGAVEDVLPTLLDLAGIPAEILPPHQPFDGISLRPAVMDAGAPEEDRGIFRMALAFEGSPEQSSMPSVAGTGLISDPRQLKFEDHHFCLRGPRFKFHSLRGGGTMLVDLQTDPGETLDVSGEHPEIARSMAEACRKWWDGLIAEGRAFRRPVIHPTPGPSAKNRTVVSIPANAATAVTGSVKVVTSAVEGFQKAGDMVTYEVEAGEPGRYRLEVIGNGLASGRGWMLTPEGAAAVPGFVQNDRLSFEAFDIPAGHSLLSFGIREAAGPDEKPAALSQLVFVRQP